MSVCVEKGLLLFVTIQVPRMVFQEAVSVWETSVAEGKLTFLPVPRASHLLCLFVAVVALTTSLVTFL